MRFLIPEETDFWEISHEKGAILIAMNERLIGVVEYIELIAVIIFRLYFWYFNERRGIVTMANRVLSIANLKNEKADKKGRFHLMEVINS